MDDKKNNKPAAAAPKADSDKHGIDEQGAPAPSQGDQAIMNSKRMEAESKGEAKADPRWPMMASVMKAVPPHDQETAKALEEHNAKLAKDAEKNDLHPSNAKTSAPKDDKK